MSTPEIEAAIAALRSGRTDEALQRLRAAGPAATDDPLALQAWAVSLRGPENRALSIALLERAVRIAPADAQAHFNLAVTLQGMDDFPRAIAHYEQALRLAPQDTGSLNNLSDLLRRRGRPEEGWALMQRYLAAGGSPQSQELRLAKLGLDTRRFDDSEQWFQAAAAAEPNSPTVRFEHAMLTLLREDWARGWPQYEERVGMYGTAKLGMFPHAPPLWNGVAKPGSAVLLHREQGLGDMMMFASALDGIIEEGVTPHLAMAPGLNRLFAASFPKARVWSSITMVGQAKQPEQRYLKVCGPLDAQAPMCSLGALRMASGPPERRAYLKAPPAEVALWKERLEALAPPVPGERRIGIVMGARLPRFSDDGMTNGLRKSIPALDLEALADVPNARWFALHDRESAAQLADVPSLPIVDLSHWITDMADTAAAIANLDLVVSVDTAVAHLTGAMGKPLVLMLWRNADWRWGVDREDSVWYPNVRTFRQTRPGRWAEVVERVAKALS